MIDVVQQINAVHRHVGTRGLGPGEARVVTISRAYESSIDDVWDACTSPERIPRWFLPISGDLGVGGRYQLEGNASGTIEACDPPHRFAATWEYGESVTRIEVRLVPEPDGRTRFELEHTLPADDQWAELGPGAVGVGWDLAVMGLNLHLSSGHPVDAGEIAAWNESDEGRDFMAASSRRWRDAHIHAGAGRDDAWASARRTTTAYTGRMPDAREDTGS
jgi:uncharacterized protein YndB with AHSA1/START domain